eukprot:5479524-Karenia_brevis.AAC.1
MVQKDFETLRAAHVYGAATEFQIQTVWELLQHLALKHNEIGATAMEASNKITAILQGLGDEINFPKQLPTGAEQAQVCTRVYFNWLKPQIDKLRYGQEIAQRMSDRKYYVHPAGEATMGPGGHDLGVKISMRAAAAACSGGAAPYFAPG